ncbi:MAG TPA: hypothetical protein VF748_16025 [Candidatus Acidoferrum sp.]
MEQIKVFSSRGDDVLLEYDPATADMNEVNAALDKLEESVAGRAFSMATGEAVEIVTPETRDTVIIRPIAGG